MRIASGPVVVLVLLVTSCSFKPGAYQVGGTTAQCIEGFAFPSFCRSSLCIGVRVLDERGAPLPGALVAAWREEETFEEGTSPTPLLTARTGISGRVILFLERVEIPRGGVWVSADGRANGYAFVLSETPVRTLPECFDFVLSPVSPEAGP